MAVWDLPPQRPPVCAIARRSRVSACGPAGLFAADHAQAEVVPPAPCRPASRQPLAGAVACRCAGGAAQCHPASIAIPSPSIPAASRNAATSGHWSLRIQMSCREFQAVGQLVTVCAGPLEFVRCHPERMAPVTDAAGGSSLATALPAIRTCEARAGDHAAGGLPARGRRVGVTDRAQGFLTSMARGLSMAWDGGVSLQRQLRDKGCPGWAASFVGGSVAGTLVPLSVLQRFQRS
jgi:hypothetical protein